VSDAGTPGISDPGSRLVAAVRQAGLLVVPIPGPSAITTALSIAGMEADTFCFLGYPPATGQARNRWFERLDKEPGTVVFFESPHRIQLTLGELQKAASRRRLCLCRELSKIHESSVISPINSLDSVDAPSLGEYVLVLGPTEHHQSEAVSHDGISLFSRLTELAGFTEDDAAHIVSIHAGVSKASVKKAVKKHRYSVKR
jgi:16S rRNA (cytidine1402-2'-O)-methyltransferase